MSIPQYNFENRDAIAEALAQQIATDLSAAIEENGRASLAVSGGSTPKHLFNVLSNHTLDWSKVCITLVDERCVTIDNERSNAKLVKDHLLQNKAKAAQFIPLFSNADASANKMLILPPLRPM